VQAAVRLCYEKAVSSSHRLAVTLGLVIGCSPAPAASQASAPSTPAPVVPAAKAPVAKVVLPADKANNVSPLLGKAVLVLSTPMAEPPKGKLTMLVHDGTAWVDSGIEARDAYDAATRQWTWTLASRAFPPNSLVRLELRPTGGRDSAGHELARAPIRWSFSTGANPLSARGTDGGCPVNAPPNPAPTGEPCPK